jgi:hypothetical protein
MELKAADPPIDVIAKFTAETAIGSWVGDVPVGA